MKQNHEYAWHPTSEYTENSVLAGFMNAHGIHGFDALYRLADEDPQWYWKAVMEYFDVRFQRPYEKLQDTGPGLPWSRWCVGGTTNVTLNCLDRHEGTPVMDKTAVIWAGEGGETRTWTYGDLLGETARLAGALRGLGLGKGDTIGLYMPIMPEAMAAFFAIAKIGAIVVPLFSGFGAEALVDRLSDARCAALITVEATRRRGKTVVLEDIAREAAGRVPSIGHLIVLESVGVGPKNQDREPHAKVGSCFITRRKLTRKRSLYGINEHFEEAFNAVRGCEATFAYSSRGRAKDHEETDRHAPAHHRWQEITAPYPATAPTEEMSAEDPFMIIFTSGTTDKAKGTVHTHCSFLVKMVADLGLCMDFKPDDRLLWMSDLGWLIGPMQFVVSTFFGATTIQAEGTPDYPEPGRLWHLVQDHRVTYLGIAPTIARLMMRYGTGEVEKYDLSSLRVTISSGEVWNPDSWGWFFQHVCKGRVPNLNVSGGTEIGWGIVTCTVVQPHKPCAFSTGVLGMGADVVDAGGNTMPAGRMGELVLRHPSIGLSRGLWNDPERYLETYWNKIPDLWVHGDWASRDEDGTWYLHGRSDDTIMVAGKRCGPAEVESLLMETGGILEAAATAIGDPLKGEAILCVCVAGKEIPPNEELVERLRGAVTRALGPAFRPAAVVFVDELPKTRSMKVMRRVIRALYEGRDPGDLASLVNPGALKGLREVFAGRR